MEGYKEQFDSLLNRGYRVTLFKEERDTPSSGKYTAFCVMVKKEGEEIKHTSRISIFAALKEVMSVVNVMEQLYKDNQHAKTGENIS